MICSGCVCETWRVFCSPILVVSTFRFIVVFSSIDNGADKETCLRGQSSRQGKALSRGQPEVSMVVVFLCLVDAMVGLAAVGCFEVVFDIILELS